jgi:hypothetical protein
VVPVSGNKIPILSRLQVVVVVVDRKGYIKKERKEERKG